MITQLTHTVSDVTMDVGEEYWLLKYWYKLVIKIDYQLWYGSVSRERERERDSIIQYH